MAAAVISLEDHGNCFVCQVCRETDRHEMCGQEVGGVKSYKILRREKKCTFAKHILEDLSDLPPLSCKTLYHYITYSSTSLSNLHCCKNILLNLNTFFPLAA